MRLIGLRNALLGTSAVLLGLCGPAYAEDIVAESLDAFTWFLGLSAQDKFGAASCAFLFYKLFLSDSQPETPIGGGLEGFETEAKVNLIFDNKILAMRYTNKIMRNIPYMTRGNVGRIWRARKKYTIQRTVAAMPHREREAARILFILYHNKAIKKREFDNLRFALTWAGGNGQCAMKGFKVPAEVASQHGIYSGMDLMNYEARHRGVSVEAAVSSIFAHLQAAILKRRPKPAMVRLARRLFGGNAWLQAENRETAMLTSNPAAGGLLLGDGKDDGKPVYYTGRQSLVTIAPPGSGKTQCHVIPNLLLWEGPALVLDVTGSLWKTTSRQRKRFGPVYRIDLDNVEQSDRYNPIMGGIRQDPRYAWEDAQAFAHLAYVKQSHGEQFWDNAAIDLITAAVCFVALYYPDHKRTFESVLAIISGMTFELFVSEAAGKSEVPALQQAAASLSRLDPRTSSNIFQTAATALSAWRSAAVSQITATLDWDPATVRADNATVYICLSAQKLETNAGLVRLIVGQHIRALINQPVTRDKTPWFQFFLDELPQLKQMDVIRQALELGQNYNLRLWMFMQFQSQLEAAYGQGIAQGMIGACGVQAYMNPPMHDGTAEMLSRNVGMAESLIDQTRRNVVEPQELAGASFQDDVIAVLPGHRPLRLRKHMYHDDPKLRSKEGAAY